MKLFLRLMRFDRWDFVNELDPHRVVQIPGPAITAADWGTFHPNARIGLIEICQLNHLETRQVYSVSVAVKLDISRGIAPDVIVLQDHHLHLQCQR